MSIEKDIQDFHKSVKNQINDSIIDTEREFELFKSVTLNLLQSCNDKESFEKSWSTDLQKQFPNGVWRRVGGSNVFINHGRVVAGLDKFNGMIDDFFSKKESGKEKESENKNNDSTLQRVKHAQFGEGNVLEQDDKTITIQFDTEGKKKLLKQFVKLETLSGKKIENNIEPSKEDKKEIKLIPKEKVKTEKDWDKIEEQLAKDGFYITTESSKGVQLEKDGHKFWIKKQWINKEGKLTSAGEKSLQESKDKGKQKEESEKFVKLDKVRVVGESESGNAVKLSVKINNSLKEFDKEFYVPKSAYSEENGGSVKQGMLAQKLNEVLGSNQAVSISRVDIAKETEKAYGISSYVEDFHTERELKHTIWIPKSLSKKDENGNLIAPQWLIDKAIEENKESHRHGAYQYVQFGGGITNGYEPLPIKIV